MKERPILFSTSMVQAILAGRKTQTRRVVKPERWMVKQNVTFKDASVDQGFYGPNDQYLKVVREIDETRHRIVCPYGSPGDRLWVRETWRVGAWNNDTGTVAIDYRSDNSSRREWIVVQDDDAFTRLYVQSVEDAQFKLGHKENYKWNPGESPCRWRSSLHMRREFSRITLEITAIRVERLNQIEYKDCKAEGLQEPRQFAQFGASAAERDELFRVSYKTLWETINGPGSWDKNPWVWVVEFKRC